MEMMGNPVLTVTQEEMETPDKMANQFQLVTLEEMGLMAGRVKEGRTDCLVIQVCQV